MGTIRSVVVVVPRSGPVVEVVLAGGPTVDVVDDVATLVLVLPWSIVLVVVDGAFVEVVVVVTSSPVDVLVELVGVVVDVGGAVVVVVGAVVVVGGALKNAV